MKNRLWKLIRWTGMLSVGYLIITTLFFGYSQVDEQKGMYTFYWSGINAIFDQSKDFGFERNKILETELNGLDGPYIIGNTSYYVDEKNQFYREVMPSGGKVNVKLDRPVNMAFNVQLQGSYKPELQFYAMPKKLIAISDIEGNFTGFYSFLFANKIIDKNCNWIYGDGHLVLNGDFVDRGRQVTQVLWLIYKLDHQAKQSGGKVHYILGNHEIMMLQGNVSYANSKYIEAAKRISRNTNWRGAMRYLYSSNSELGKWLRTKNIIEKIGSTIFVHGGLNMQHVNEKISIEEFNNIARLHYGANYSNQFNSLKERLTLNSIHSPYWDRGLAMDLKHRILYFFNGLEAKGTTQTQVDSILDFYKASRIVIGHSIVDDIQYDYNRTVVKIDIKHSEAMWSGSTKGILIKNAELVELNDKSSSKILSANVYSRLIECRSPNQINVEPLIQRFNTVSRFIFSFT
jgi:hypothetical protein